MSRFAVEVVREPEYAVFRTNGYINNLAVGKLTLDGGGNGLMHFAPPLGQTGRAIYVDYLELNGFGSNYLNALDISPDFTLYFANANINPAKLDTSFGDRLRWVKDFTGPLSSTNILYPPSSLYPTGHVYTFNIAVVQSLDLDSDGDGTVDQTVRGPSSCRTRHNRQASRETRQRRKTWEAPPKGGQGSAIAPSFVSIAPGPLRHSRDGCRASCAKPCH